MNLKRFFIVPCSVSATITPSLPEISVSSVSHALTRLLSSIPLYFEFLPTPTVLEFELSVHLRQEDVSIVQNASEHETRSSLSLESILLSKVQRILTKFGRGSRDSLVLAFPFALAETLRDLDMLTGLNVALVEAQAALRQAETSLSHDD